MQDLDSGSRPAARVEILGVEVSPVDPDAATETIESWIGRRDRNYVCVTGAHGIMESRRSRRLRDIHNAAGLVVPDGVPLVWVARLLGWTHMRRVYGPDLMRRMTEISARRGYRQFYYGGARGVAEKLRDVLTRANPTLMVCGVFCPPFRAPTGEEDQAVIDMINAARPDIVWVGLSTPKQEQWMADHLGRIEAPVMIGVGAAFDFLAGIKPQAPAWMQRNGLEWTYRLYSEPRRLWRRYAYIVPGFAALATVSLLGRGARAIATRLQRGFAAAPVSGNRPPSSAA